MDHLPILKTQPFVMVSKQVGRHDHQLNQCRLPTTTAITKRWALFFRVVRKQIYLTKHQRAVVSRNLVTVIRTRETIFRPFLRRHRRHSSSRMPRSSSCFATFASFHPLQNIITMQYSKRQHRTPSTTKMAAEPACWLRPNDVILPLVLFIARWLTLNMSEFCSFLLVITT